MDESVIEEMFQKYADDDPWPEINEFGDFVPKRKYTRKDRYWIKKEEEETSSEDKI